MISQKFQKLKKEVEKIHGGGSTTPSNRTAKATPGSKSNKRKTPASTNGGDDEDDGGSPKNKRLAKGKSGAMTLEQAQQSEDEGNVKVEDTA